MNVHAWDHAVRTHIGARICEAVEKDRRGRWQPACSFPLDPALGADVRMHPWCETTLTDRVGLQRRRELAAVRLADIRRTRLAAIAARVED